MSADDEQETRTAAGRARLDDGELETLGPARRVGRYMILSLVGSGGMGQVYAAYDPQLDRRVAVKLLHDTGSEADRLRLTREAKALARMSHPNVVTVHEVGEQDGRLLIAMEFVEGETLKDWLQHNPPNERRDRTLMALDLLIQAGAGLVAAHERGLVHRDFKPANVLVGRDGRVRVADFGLARAVSDAPFLDDSVDVVDQSSTSEPAVTEAGRVVGTPAYMAPEQLAGRDLDAKADQFSYCVTAWEVLFGERPFVVGAGDATPHRPEGVELPGALEGALRKGLATRPRRRHDGVDVLLGILQREADAMRGAPTRRRPALKVTAAVVLLAGVAVGAQRLDRARTEARCVVEGDAIDDVWNETSRSAVRSGLKDIGGAFAPEVAEKVMPWLDAQAQSWREHTTLACMNTNVHERWDLSRFEKAQWCLEDRRLEFAGLVAQLTEADAAFAEKAVQAAAGLAPTASCVDEVALSGLPPLPDAETRERATEVRELLARAEGLEAAGKYEVGLEAAREAVERAEAIGWAPLTARARNVEALLLERVGKYAESEAASIAAFAEAGRSGAWKVAAIAANDLAYRVGYVQARMAEGRVWARFAGVAIELVGDPGKLEESSHANALGTMYVQEGQLLKAEEQFRKALAIREDVFGSEHILAVDMLANVASILLVQGEAESARNLLLRVVAVMKRTLGGNHPQTADALFSLGITCYQMGEYVEARRYFEGALIVFESSYGAAHPKLADSLEGLGNLYGKQGDAAQALSFHRRALAIREASLGLEHPAVAKSLSNVGSAYNVLGDQSQAQEYFARAVGIMEVTHGPEHIDTSIALSNLANSYRFQGKNAEAKPLFVRALAIKEKALDSNHPTLAFTLQALGDVLIKLGEYEQGLLRLERAVAIRSRDAVAPDLGAHSRFALAKASWDAPPDRGGDRERAVELAEQARRVFEESGESFASNAEEVDAWLREHRPAVADGTTRRR